jgi:uncharacterized glyoxalase superfamily protein PhnB
MVATLDDGFRSLLHARIPGAHDLDLVPYPWPASSISLLVADVDDHFRHAASEGAVTLDTPTDQPWGIRTYAAIDLDGHHWQFAQHLRHVTPEDWGATRT